MKRTITVALLAAVALSACGGSDEPAWNQPNTVESSCENLIEAVNSAYKLGGITFDEWHTNMDDALATCDEWKAAES